ncbi:MAG: hypothetical protein QOD36_405 [Mycobacterium sp.]|jgi:hypothetical protein|nr:hypothetical protein [Mycobacterium sp.]MDT5334142.1 hypothetical protein [Mycobacterium sp.]
MVDSKRFVRFVTVGACALALCALSPVATASADDLNLVGSWTGHRERIASTEGYRNGTATLVVTEQTGWTFKGYMQWSTPHGPLQDDLVGAFTPDGTLVAGSDAEGTYSFKLVDPVTLDDCYAEHGQGYRTTCARLQKEV